MDAQSDSCKPDSQPPGKIRKALKLFSKHRPGSGVASIFNVGVKVEGGCKIPRSKTKDGLTEALDTEAGAESVDLDQEDRHNDDTALDEVTSMKTNLESTSTRHSISSLASAKSLSLLSMLRRNRKGEGEERPHRPGQQRKGLKFLLGSVRWHRKDKEMEDEVLPEPPLLASPTNSVKNLAQTPMPAHHSTTDELEFKQPLPSQDDQITSENINKVSGAAKPSSNDRLSMLLGDISSILSLDSLSGGDAIAADVEAEWVKVSSHVGVEDDPGKAVKHEKDVLPSEPIFLATHFHSSTTSTIPSPEPKIISSPKPPKPLPSPTTKQTLSPPSTSTTIISTVLYNTSAPKFSLDQSPVCSSNSSSINSPETIPGHSPTYTPNLTTPTSPSLMPISPVTPEPSPKPTPTPFLTTGTISRTAESVDSATIHLPNYTLCPTPKNNETTASTSITKPVHSVAQYTKHNSAPVNKYPPFITSTKPITVGPVIRPKIVTTFGLSTSRNTAPIIKPEPKQSAHQIKSGPSQSQSEKNGPGSVVPKASSSEPEPPHVAKNPTYKTELVQNFLPSEASLLPILTMPGPNIITRSESRQEDISSPNVLEDPQTSSFYKIERRTIVMKPTTLSKIPVSGGGKSKHHHKDAASNDGERQRNNSTPVHEDKHFLSRESSINDALNNVFTESGADTLVQCNSNEDILDTAANITIGTASINRESKIPIKSGSTATYHPLQGKTEVARSKIPVSKVYGRRTSSKTGPPLTVAITRK